jgi:putative pyruvate formate lyase activating enzyme
MPDFKFWDPSVAQETCDARDYPEVARKAVVEMHRQVGDLCIDEESGLAYKGLLVRHLVLPGGLAGTRPTMEFLAKTISRNTYVNVMAQYRPCGGASTIKALDGPISTDAYHRAVEETRAAGIARLDRPKRVFRIW